MIVIASIYVFLFVIFTVIGIFLVMNGRKSYSMFYVWLARVGNFLLTHYHLVLAALFFALANYMAFAAYDLVISIQ